MSDTGFTEYQAGTHMHYALQCGPADQVHNLKVIDAMPIIHDGDESWLTDYPTTRVVTREQAATALVKGRIALYETRKAAMFAIRKELLDERERLALALREVEQDYLRKLSVLVGRELLADELAALEKDYLDTLPVRQAAARLAAERDAAEWRKFEESLTPEDRAEAASNARASTAASTREKLERQSFEKYRALINSVEAGHLKRK